MHRRAVLSLLYFKSVLQAGQASILNIWFGMGFSMALSLKNWLLNISKNRKLYKSVALPIFKLIVIILQIINKFIIQFYVGGLGVEYRIMVKTFWVIL